MQSLQSRIDESLAAAAELARQEELKQKAGELTSLLQERERRDQAEAATIRLETELSSVAQRLENLTQAAGLFQKRFSALQNQLAELQAVYARLEQERTAIRGGLASSIAAWQRDNARQVWFGGRQEWTAPFHPTADALAEQARRVSLFPGEVSEYPTDRGYDTLAAVVAGGDIRRPSWRGGTR